MNCPKCFALGCIATEEVKDGYYVDVTCPLCHGSGAVPDDYGELKQVRDTLRPFLPTACFRCPVCDRKTCGLNKTLDLELALGHCKIHPDCPAAKALESE